MKKALYPLAIFLMITALGGCVTVNFSNHISAGSITGAGSIIRVDYEAAGFNKIAVSSVVRLYYSYAENWDVYMELHENLADEIMVSARGDTLLIESRGNINGNNPDRIPALYVSAPVLEGIVVEGLLLIEEGDQIAGDVFTLDVSGVLTGFLSLDVKELYVRTSGVGEINLEGAAGSAVLRNSGVGAVKAFNLETKDAEAEVSGVGSIEINCSGTLVAKVSGIGSIEYKGNALVAADSSGIGQINKADG